MKRLVSFFAAIAIVGALATSALAVSSTVSISGAQFSFSGNTFSTASGSSVVSATFFNTSGVQSSFFGNASFQITPGVNFSGGLTSGTGGGFILTDNVTLNTLLSGTFGNGSTLSNQGSGLFFEANVISTFVNPNIGLAGTSFNAPGQFSASGGGIVGNFSGPWTTNGAAVASISSAVPEPASLMLLGAGLAGIGIWRRKSAKI